jgi:transposase
VGGARGRRIDYPAVSAESATALRGRATAAQHPRRPRSQMLRLLKRGEAATSPQGAARVGSSVRQVERWRQTDRRAGVPTLAQVSHLPVIAACGYDLPGRASRNDARGMARRTDRGGAGWRGEPPQWRRAPAGGIVPVRLPPYRPELHPAQQVPRHLGKRLANRIFATIAEMRDALVAEMRRLDAHPKEVTRMTNYPWRRDGIAATTPPLS